MSTLNERTPARRAAPHAFALSAILLGALALRLYGLGEGSIWYDEGVSLYLARLSLPAMVAHTAGDIHPPLYYAALHAWLRLAGASQFAAAFFSLFCGMLLVAAVYALARRLFGAPVALLAALLAAISPYHLWYSQEMRMYTLGALLGVLSFYWLLEALGWRAVSGNMPDLPTAPAARAWIGYVICAALGLYTLYYFAFLLLFEAAAVVALWLRSRRKARPPLPLRAWLAAQLAVALLFLPWLPVAVRQATQPPVPPWRVFTGLGALLGESWSALALGQSVRVTDVALVLLLCALLYGLALHAGDARAAVWLLAGYTFAPLLVIYAASLWTPLYHVRYVFLYAPAFVIVLARGLSLVRQRAPAVAALALAVLVLASASSAQAYFGDPAYAVDDHRSAVRMIAQQARPGDALLINAGYAYPTFDYYYDGDIAWQGRLVDYVARAPVGAPGLVVLQTGSIGGDATLGWGSATSDFYATTEAETTAALDEVARRHERLWVLRIYDTVTDPQGFIRRYLDDNFLPLDDAGFAGSSSMRVQLYRTRRAPVTTAPALPNTVNANVANRLRLLGYDLSGELRPGEAAYLRIAWQAVQPGADLRAFAGLFDSAGREWAHWDEVPAGRLYPTSRWAANEVVSQWWRLDIPPGTPPGAYSLVSGLYDASSSARLDVLDSAGRPTGAAVRLGEVVVGAARRAVNLASLPMQHTVGASLAGEVRLLGYSVSSRLAQPGGALELTAFWQGMAPVAGERVVFVQLLDGAGKLWATAEGPPVAPWAAGQVLRDRYRLPIPADAPDGELRLIMGVYRAGDRQRLPVKTGLLGRASDHVSLGVVRIAGREHVYAAPAMQKRVDARLGDGAALLGYDIAADGTLAPGAVVRLTLYWQGVAPLDVSYTVFVQLLGDDNRSGGQRDALPGDGLLPTTSWLPGEVLSDWHDVAIRSDAPPGRYRLVAGLYDATSGARLPVTIGGVRQSDDMVVLTTVTIR